MRLKAKAKSKKLNKKLYNDLKKLEGKLKAGYPKENPQSHELDKNGMSAIDKAYEINYANKNFTPYLEISYTHNKIKYKKRFTLIAKQKPKKQGKLLEKLGEEMVDDIQSVLANVKESPLLTGSGLIFGAVSYVRVVK